MITCRCNIPGHGHPATCDDPATMEHCGAPATVVITWTEFAARISQVENPTYGCDACVADFRSRRTQLALYVEKMETLVP